MGSRSSIPFARIPVPHVHGPLRDAPTHAAGEWDAVLGDQDAEHGVRRGLTRRRGSATVGACPSRDAT
jgi:hypothetical protein